MFVCFLALRLKSTAMVMAGRSVHLTTLFLGKLSSYELIDKNSLGCKKLFTAL